MVSPPAKHPRPHGPQLPLAPAGDRGGRPPSRSGRWHGLRRRIFSLPLTVRALFLGGWFSGNGTRSEIFLSQGLTSKRRFGILSLDGRNLSHGPAHSEPPGNDRLRLGLATPAGCRSAGNGAGLSRSVRGRGPGGPAGWLAADGEDLAARHSLRGSEAVGGGQAAPASPLQPQPADVQPVCRMAPAAAVGRAEHDGGEPPARHGRLPPARASEPFLPPRHAPPRRPLAVQQEDMTLRAAPQSS